MTYLSLPWTLASEVSDGASCSTILISPDFSSNTRDHHTRKTFLSLFLLGEDRHWARNVCPSQALRQDHESAPLDPMRGIGETADIIILTNCSKAPCPRAKTWWSSLTGTNQSSVMISSYLDWAMLQNFLRLPWESRVLSLFITPISHEQGRGTRDFKSRGWWNRPGKY